MTFGPLGITSLILRTELINSILILSKNLSLMWKEIPVRKRNLKRISFPTHWMELPRLPPQVWRLFLITIIDDMAFLYTAKVVSTQITSLSGTSVTTHQYSATVHSTKKPPGGLPGICYFFTYHHRGVFRHRHFSTGHFIF